MREAKRSPELWEDGKRYAFPAFPQLLLLNKVESINPDTSGKHQPGRSDDPPLSLVQRPVATIWRRIPTSALYLTNWRTPCGKIASDGGPDDNDIIQSI